MALSSYLLKTCRHLLRYFTKISPRRAKARLRVIFVHASYLLRLFSKALMRYSLMRFLNRSFFFCESYIPFGLSKKPRDGTPLAVLPSVSSFKVKSNSSSKKRLAV
jgi:hypothetical protein